MNFEPRRGSLAERILLRKNHESTPIQFSDIQLMERGSHSEEVILRPKLLKQQRTESPPPGSPTRTIKSATPPTTSRTTTSILKNGGLTLSGTAATSATAHAESIELPNADGKFNDNLTSPTLTASRRRSVFVRLKSFVLRSVSIDESDSGK